MAAEVSFLVQMMSSRYKEGEREGERKTDELVTRDLLGGCCLLGSKELDHDKKATSGWQKHFDLMSGEAFTHRAPNTTNKKSSPAGCHVDDLNYPLLPPTSTFPPLLPSAAAASPDLDLQLFHSSSTTSEYQSVCTLDKVKSALEREGRQDSSTSAAAASRKKHRDQHHKEGGQSRSRSSSVEGEEKGGDGGGGVGATLVAAGCPNCLLYVLISGRNPRCPRCDTDVPFPAAQNIKKKARVDLDLNSAYTS